MREGTGWDDERTFAWRHDLSPCGSAEAPPASSPTLKTSIYDASGAPVKVQIDPAGEAYGDAKVGIQSTHQSAQDLLGVPRCPFYARA